MLIDRRSALLMGSAAALSACGEKSVYAPRPDGWRAFELVTTLDIPRQGDPAQAWVPVPSVEAEDWMRPGDVRFETDAPQASVQTDPASGARFVHARWPEGDTPAQLTVTATAATRSCAVDPQAAAGAVLTPEERDRYTSATNLIPTDGIVAATAALITKGAETDFEKAHAIYDWIVRNTARNPLTRGCGLGDVASMLERGDLTGKCADLNTLYVGLARASGLPARDLYGIRVAPSAFGYSSLGTSSPAVTKAQHCRAEVFLDGSGWVPVDPADVRKVMLEEDGDRRLPLRNPKVRAVREALFGAWEGNWVAYNTAHDIDLPGADFGALPFLMYPQAELGTRRLDELDPEGFRYTITAREMPV